MKIFCITLGLFMVSFSTVQGQVPSFAPHSRSFFNSAQPFSLDGQSGNASLVWTGDVERYEGEEARKMIVVKDRYVRVTYRKEDGKTETAEGFVRAMDETELTIYRGGLRKRILRARIEVLLVYDHLRQLQRVKDSFIEQSSSNNRVAKKLSFGALSGGLLGFLGGAIALIGAEDCGYDDTGCGFGKLYSVLFVGGIGYTVGVPIGVSITDPYDSLGKTLMGSLMGAAASGVISALAASSSSSESIAEGMIVTSILGLPLAGAVMMSERSRDSFGSRSFSVGIAPNREGNLSAVATLRF